MFHVKHDASRCRQDASASRRRRVSSEPLQRESLKPTCEAVKPSPFVEPVGVGPCGIRGQLDQLAVLAARFGDRPLDELGAQAAAPLVRVDAYGLDDRACGALAGQSRNDSELEGADDAALTYGDDQVLVRVGGQAFQRGQVGRQVVRDSRWEPRGSSASMPTMAGTSSVTAARISRSPMTTP